MHRTCIGLLLGFTMMIWAAMGVWILMGAPPHWDWRAAHWNGDMVQYLRDLWITLPPKVDRIFPWACFGALAAGITINVFSPKLGKVLAHSLVGVTLAALMGAIAANIVRPNWLNATPGSNLAQSLFLIGLVVLGALIQWRITPPHRPSASNVARKT